MEAVPVIRHTDDKEAGGKYDCENGFTCRKNVADAPIRVRMAFIRKVYLWILMDLGTSIFITAVIMQHPNLMRYVASCDSLKTMLLVLNFAMLIALAWYRDTPKNFILLAVYTALGIAHHAFSVPNQSEFTASVLAFTALLGLTAYTFQSKRDFSYLGFRLFAVSSIILPGLFINATNGSSPKQYFISIGLPLFISLIIVYVTKKMMKKLSPEEYILAIISIYVEMITSFVSSV